MDGRGNPPAIPAKTVAESFRRDGRNGTKGDKMVRESKIFVPLGRFTFAPDSFLIRS